MRLLCEKERQFQHNLNILQHRRQRAWISRPLGSKVVQSKDVCPLVVLHCFCAVLCRQRPCDGPTNHSNSPTNYLKVLRHNY